MENVGGIANANLIVDTVRSGSEKFLLMINDPSDRMD